MAQQIIDLINGMVGGPALRPTSITGAATGGLILDLHEGINSCNAIMEVGTFTGASPNLNAALYESDDQSTWSAMANASFTITAANSRATVRALRTKRYVQLSITTFTGTAALVSVEVIEQNKYTYGGSQTGISRSPSN